jgi:hypothetical protein
LPAPEWRAAAAQVDGTVADVDDDDEPADTIKLRSRARRAD